MKISTISAAIALLIFGIVNAAPTKNNNEKSFSSELPKDLDNISLSGWLLNDGVQEDDEPSSPARSSMESASSVADVVPEVQPTSYKPINFAELYDDSKDLAHAENFPHLSAYLQSTDTGIYRDRIQIEIVMAVHDHLLALVGGPNSERLVHQKILSHLDGLCKLWSQIPGKPQKYEAKRLMHDFLQNVE